MSSISLTAGQRSSLLSLQNTQSLSERTQSRLTTGKKVNSVTDDAVAFFRSKALSERAGDFLARKDGIDQGISTLNATLDTMDSIDSLVKQMKGIAEAAKSGTDAERVSATEQFKEIGKQIYQMVEDASYQGLNLLTNTGTTLDVKFGTRTASQLQVDGIDLNSTATTSAGLFTNAAFDSTGDFLFSAITSTAVSPGFSSIGTNNSNVAGVDTLVQTLDDAISNIRAKSAAFGTNVAILNTRLDFTTQYVNTLQAGADKLTLADLNEEGANLSALQTRQQLGIQALAIAGQQQQAILQLLG